MWDLVPFSIVTFIVILVFTFMYFIQEFQEEGYEDFYASFLTVFSNFVGDPRPAEGVLDLIFGVVVVVVLLNVVIAIVSASWEDAVNTSLILLCTHRLQLLRRANDNSAMLPHWFGGEWWIDSKFDELMDRCLDQVREEYEFWVGFNQWHPTAFLWSGLYLFMFLFRPFMTCMMWIIGSVTFGLTWSLNVRMYLFGIKPAKDTLYIRMERMEDVTQKLSSETHKIHDEVKTRNENRKHDDPDSARDKEIDMLHTKIDNLRELFERTRTRTSQASNTSSGADLAGPRSNHQDRKNVDKHDASNVGGGMTMVEMQQEMQILHTKIDLVLEYVMSQSANDRVRRRSTLNNNNNNNNAQRGTRGSMPGAVSGRHGPDRTDSIRPEDFRDARQPVFGVVSTSRLDE
jgi:hypothetical protein